MNIKVLLDRLIDSNRCGGSIVHWKFIFQRSSFYIFLSSRICIPPARNYWNTQTNVHYKFNLPLRMGLHHTHAWPRIQHYIKQTFISTNFLRDNVYSQLQFEVINSLQILIQLILLWIGVWIVKDYLGKSSLIIALNVVFINLSQEDINVNEYRYQKAKYMSDRELRN